MYSIEYPGYSIEYTPPPSHLGWYIRLHRVTRPGIVVFSGSMGRQMPAKKFFHTTRNEVVYMKTFILSAIL